MDVFLLDLRFAVRTLRRRPGFCLVAILTLALGMGANSVMFSLSHALLLRPLPFKDQERVGLLWRVTDRLDRSPFSIPTYRDIQQRNRCFESLAIYRESTHNLTQAGGEPERLAGLMVGHEFLQAMGVEPIAGRGFLPDDDRPGARRTALISEELWQRRFAGDVSLVGKDILLNNVQHTVLGIFPAGLRGEPLHPYRMGDVWLPIGLFHDQLPVDERETRSGTFAVARLKPDIGWQEARQDVERIGRELKADFPLTMSKSDLKLRSLSEDRVREVRPTLLLLQGTVGLVLLLACANLAHLMLVCVGARQVEFATRAALGAGRGRLMAQTLVESLLLALAGGTAGILAAVWGIRALPALLPPEMVPASGLRLDAPLLLFNAAAALAAYLLLGLLPAWQASRSNFRPVHAVRFTRRGRLRHVLVSAEVAAALVLTIGAALMLGSLMRLGGQDPGFRPEKLLSLQVSLPQPEYSESSDWIGFFDRALEEIRGISGVSQAAAASLLPLVVGDDRSITVAGDRPLPPVPQMSTTVFQTVSPGFFRTMGIPLISGRTFQDGDDERGDSELVTVVNQALAEHFWPGQEAVGQQIAFEFKGNAQDPQPQFRRIVGVVGSVRHVSLKDEPLNAIYVSHRQPALWHRMDWPSMALVIRSQGDDPLALTGAVRERLKSIDPRQPIFDVQTVESAVSAQFGRPQLILWVLTTFAGLALIMALVGVYGVINSSVTAGNREIATRMALGARPSEIQSALLRRTLLLILAGVLIGLPAAAGLSRLMSSLLFQVQPFDPVFFGTSTLLIVLMGTAATLIPARRAARTDPARVLRCE